MTTRKRLLIVDDSPTARLGLRRLLESSNTFEVVGEAENGATAVELCAHLQPDLITMDVYLAGEDGLDATRQIMASSPRPIVIVTALDPARANLAFRATEVGALDVLRKPPFDDSTASQNARRRFLAALSSLSQVKLFAQRGGAKAIQTPVPPISGRRALPPLVAFGASTGGPAVLQRILKALPTTLPAGIVIVQHIEQGFASGLAEFLATSGHRIELVRRTTTFERGRVFLAPDDSHLHLTRAGLLMPVSGEPRRFQLPSIDEFFDNVPEALARSSFAALLTGMGDDGARGLLRLRQHGALTVVQASESCVVPSMPEAAWRLGAAAQALDPEAIARAANHFVGGLASAERENVL